MCQACPQVEGSDRSGEGSPGWLSWRALSWAAAKRGCSAVQACRATLSIPVQASQGHQRPQGLPAGLPHHRSVSQAGQGGCYLPVTQKGGTQPAYLPRLAPDTLLPAAIGEAADEPRVGLGELPDPQADGGRQGGQARPQVADLGLGS